MRKSFTSTEAAGILGCSTSYVTELARSRKILYTHKDKGKQGKYHFARGALQAFTLFGGSKRVTERPIIKDVLEDLVEKVGPEVGEFFADEPGCIVCDMSGFINGLALLFYLGARGKDVTLACIERGTEEWENENVAGRKILLVTCYGYGLPGVKEKMEEALRERCRLAGIEIGEIRTFAYLKDEGNDSDYFFQTYEDYEEHLASIDI